jgi:hypothetical protein
MHSHESWPRNWVTAGKADAGDTFFSCRLRGCSMTWGPQSGCHFSSADCSLGGDFLEPMIPGKKLTSDSWSDPGGSSYHCSFSIQCSQKPGSAKLLGSLLNTSWDSLFFHAFQWLFEFLIPCVASFSVKNRGNAFYYLEQCPKWLNINSFSIIGGRMLIACASYTWLSNTQ